MKIDVTPHPRILQVLGEIEFKPWQCVAELVDNAVDGFIDAKKNGTPIDNPTVQVAFGQDTVVIKDNGPGMSLSELENAVKAGWTSHEPFGSLGLYGVGFNIATARLGSTTTIWTTKTGDKQWQGLELDLNKIIKGGSFLLEAKTRTKSDKSESGTEVNIASLKNDWKSLFINAAWVRNNVTEKLSRIYGAMLRRNNPEPISFTLQINNKKVPAWEHCVWPADWSVYRKTEGLVYPIIEINQTYGVKFLSKETGILYESAENLKPGDVIEVPERVYGWIGIQRYADEKDFGIDILRNGRKIELGCKDIFEWESEEGIQKEYPIDDPRGRGRIVGEIHLDHGYVHYTKDRFEREHASWKQLLAALRNNEPLIKRTDYGFEKVNTSPLGLLFRVFRRNTPPQGQSWLDYLFIKDNEKAKAWTLRWRKRDSDFTDDTKWRKELESLGENSKTDVPSSDTSLQETENSNDLNKDAQKTEVSGLDPLNPNIGQVSINSTSSSTRRKPLPEFNMHVASGVSQTGKVYDFEIYSIQRDTKTSNIPWASRATPKGIYDIEVDLDHQVFKLTSLNVQDAILAEAAHIITSEEQASLGPKELVNFGVILASLISQFSSGTSLDPAQLQNDIESLRNILIHKLSNLTEKKQDKLIRVLPSTHLKNLRLAAAQSPSNEKSKLVDFFSWDDFVYILENEPVLLFEAGCFKKEWSPENLSDDDQLVKNHQEGILTDLLLPLKKIAEFAEKPVKSVSQKSTYISFIRSCKVFFQDQISMD